MYDDKDPMPSDQEDSGLEPRNDRESGSTPPPDRKKEGKDLSEQDPSEQPS